MLLLILGLLLWFAAHFSKTILAGPRARLVGAIGEGGTKGVIALLLVLSIWLMTIGWSNGPAGILWQLPTWMNHLVALLMLPASILFFGSSPGSALSARVRHPQLTGFKLWAALHLILNGDWRSIVLFGALLAWGVVTLILINKRDGKGPLPDASTNAAKAWLPVIIGALFWALFLFVAHEWLFGVSPLG